MSHTLKEHFGYPTTHIACELTLLDDRGRLKLTSRVLGTPPKIYYGSLKNLDSILHKAAKHIYEHTDPFTYALFLYFNNQLDDCIDTIQRCILSNKNKDTHLGYNLWGLVLHKQKKYDEAIDKFIKSKKIKPWYAQTYVNWGAVLRDQGKYKEAIEKYQEASEIDPHSALI